MSREIYLIRLAADRQLAGIFTAFDLDDLFDQVDEVADPGSVEFCRVDILSLLWPGRAHPVPLPATDHAPNYDGMMFTDRMDREIEEAEWRRQPPTVVYFIGDGARVKIGVTSDLSARLKKLQTGNHAELTIVRTTSGGREEERAFHARFADLRVRGEWFRQAGALSDYLRGGE